VLARTADRYPTAASFAEALATAVSGAITPVTADDGANTPNNLPRQRTRFIGRDRELAECARLLGETRLLTLTGIGGSGKTRLALRLVEGICRRFSGVWPRWSIPRPSRWRGDRARVRVRPGSWTSSGNGCGKARLLCWTTEHLLGAGRPGGRAPAAGEGTLVATSREGLIEGEWPSRPLMTSPDPGADLVCGGTDAVRLFVDRARGGATSPGPKMPPPPVICRRLMVPTRARATRRG
jgi:hypothetical protein